jgi:hypothetical protein
MKNTTNQQTNAKVSIKNVRNEFKEVRGSMFACIKYIYAAFTDANGKTKFEGDLAKIMPASKKAALSEANDIMTWGNVGGTKTVKRTKGGLVTEVNYTIKASCDMVLRYYVAKYNNRFAGVPEADKVEL